MISDILSILKFVTDSETRETIQAISGLASERQKDWKKHIQVMKGEFRVSSWANINAFTNELLQRISETGISETKLQRFTTVYSELIDNAYRHGCQEKPKCKVSIDCVFSRWFIQLDVCDSGKGFGSYEAMDKVRKERHEGKRHGKSGLELVDELTDSVRVDKKHSRVSVVIAGEDRIKIHTTTESLGKNELLVITWDDDDDWDFLVPNQQPLRDALERATQPLILVRFGSDIIPKDTSKKKRRFRFRATSKVIRSVELVILDCALDRHHLFAYVIEEGWVYDYLKERETDNLRFFRNEPDARRWLIENIGLLERHSWQQVSSGRRGLVIRFCGRCGRQLLHQRSPTSYMCPCDYITEMPNAYGYDTMRICPYCHQGCRAAEKYCPSCGHTLQGFWELP